MKKVIQHDSIQESIYLIRGHRVILDYDLARLYEVEVKQLKRAVRRNANRFPDDFMLKITRSEYNFLRSQFGTLKRGQHSKYLPYAFSEHGVAMLSSVLNSDRAVQVNIAIIRTFIRMREILNTHQDLMLKLKELESRVGKHDKEIHAILNAILRLMAPPPQKKKEPIGFRPHK